MVSHRESRMAAEADELRVVVIAEETPVQVALALRPFACVARIMTGASAAAELNELDADLVVIEDGLDGIGLTRALRRLDRHARTPILLFGSGDGQTVRRTAVAAGATDVMIRPFEPLDLQIRIGNLIDLGRSRAALDQQALSIQRTVQRALAEASAREREIIRRLMLAAEFRDDQAGDHLTRVAGCTIAIAEGLGLSEEEANDIALASTMHDVGKISIPDTILMKPGPLTEAERAEMQQHAMRGFRMLSDSPSRLLQLASEIALTHHERWDGDGYPQGLAGTEIPLAGRIVAVADVFDALISERVYKRAWSPEEARRYLEENAGSHFDPDCVAAFLSRWDDIVALIQEHPAETRAA